MQFEDNIIEMSDTYKDGHPSMLMPGTTKTYSYYESRDGAEFDRTTFFGLQYMLRRYFNGQVVTRHKIEEAAESSADVHNDATIFPRAMWERVLNHHGGFLPVHIKAVPEGTVVPTGNIMMDIEDTNPKCAGLANTLETALCQLWYPCTVASLSRSVKEGLIPWFDKTVDPDGYWALDYMLHDFGMRGASCMEAAGIGGLSNLLHFAGTDNRQALKVAREFYYTRKGLGHSIVATEHSVMCAKTREGEADVVGHILNEFPIGPVSIVGDTFDIFNFCDNIIGCKYQSQVLNRDGCVIVRPDSGLPVSVLLDILDILSHRFGSTINGKGYRVLNPKVKTMWGDGLTRQTIQEICKGITDAGWSLSNMGTFGMGGGLLQRVHRDTQRFKFACSAQLQNGEWEDIYKDPIDGNKTSKAGRLMLVNEMTGLSTVPAGTYSEDKNILRTVLHNGIIPQNVLEPMELIKERAGQEIILPWEE